MLAYITPHHAPKGCVTVFVYVEPSLGYEYFFIFGVNERLRLPTLLKHIGITKVEIDIGLEKSSYNMMLFLRSYYDTEIVAFNRIIEGR